MTTDADSTNLPSVKAKNCGNMKQGSPRFKPEVRALLNRGFRTGVLTVTASEKKIMWSDSTFASRVEPLWEGDEGWCRYGGMLIVAKEKKS